MLDFLASGTDQTYISACFPCTTTKLLASRSDHSAGFLHPHVDSERGQTVTARALTSGPSRFYRLAIYSLDMASTAIVTGSCTGHITGP